MVKRLEDVFQGKKILVTGGTGCIGSEIVRRLMKYRPEVVRVFSNDENATFQMMQEIDDSSKMMHEIPNKRFLIGDVRDKERVIPAIQEAMAEPGPYLINFIVEPEENVYPMVPAGAAINEFVNPRRQK